MSAILEVIAPVFGVMVLGQRARGPGCEPDGVVAAGTDRQRRGEAHHHDAPEGSEKIQAVAKDVPADDLEYHVESWRSGGVPGGGGPDLVGEAWLAVADREIGTEIAQRSQLRVATGRCVDGAAESLGELHRGGADAARRRSDEDAIGGP